MKLSLAVNIESRNGLPFSDSYILNGYVQSDSGVAKVMKRPGLSAYHTFTEGVGQGMFEINGLTYAIIGDTVYLCSSPWTSYAIPTVTTADLLYDVVAQPPYIATPYAVLKSTKGLWTFDGSTVTKVTDADYPATTLPGIVLINGAYYVKTPTGQIYGSALGDVTSWTALNFLTASDPAGAGIALALHLNYAVSFSDASMSFYYDATNPSPGSPLAYAQNLTQQTGCAVASSIAAVGDALLFMSKTKDGRSVSILDEKALAPVRISTSSIDSILNLDSLAGASAFSLTISGRFFYLLTLPATGITLAYNLTEKHWTYWASGTTGTPVAATLTLDDDLTTVTGVLASGTLLPGVSIEIAGADNPLFNSTFTVLTSDGPTFTFKLLYNSYLIDEFGNFLTTGLGEFITAVQIPTAGAVSGTITVAEYGTTYFSVMASASSGLVLDKVDGTVSRISPTIYKDASGAIDFNIVTANIAPDDNTRLVRVGSADVRGDKVQSNAYLRYTDNDYRNWSTFRPLNMSTDRCRIVRCGATRRRAFHFRHLEDTSMRVQELILDVA